MACRPRHPPEGEYVSETSDGHVPVAASGEKEVLLADVDAQSLPELVKLLRR